ncbi:ABC transporter permease [Holosporaceae bacterium 'Namur']|nr:ABC transporter permease [Holosporaceae bacterium 'Namur']
MNNCEFKKAITDLSQGFKNWHMWYTISTMLIKQRYRRSTLGQFWLTLTTAINIFALGIIWSYLFKLPISSYLLYVASGMVFWNCINSIINDSSSIFITAEHYLKQVALPKSTFAYVNVSRNIVILGHNLIILPIIILFNAPNIHISMLGILQSFLGLSLFIINGIWISLLLGVIGTRFRDLQNIIPSLMQIILYITPVFWKIEYMPENIRWWLQMNPFYIFLSLVRDPILGSPIPSMYWIIASGITIIGLVIAMMVFTKYRKRIVYWL